MLNPNAKQPTRFGLNQRVYHYVRIRYGRNDDIFPLGSIAQGVESKVGQNKDWHILDGSELDQKEYPEFTTYLQEYSPEWLFEGKIKLPNFKKA